MAGFHHFSPLSYRDHWEPLPGECERSLSPWAQTQGSEGEEGSPWLHPSFSPTLRPRRRGYTASPRESHSLTHVSRRTPDRVRKYRSGNQHLEDAWMDAPTKYSPARQQQPPLHPQPCRCSPPAQGDAAPLYPGEAQSSLSVGSLRLEKAQTGDRWAVPVCRPGGLRSPSSVLTDKSSVHSQDCRSQSACVCPKKRDSVELFESLPSHYSQPSAINPETLSQQARALRSKLEEAMASSRDQKIVALVLNRLKKAQKMRELQKQAAVAWEELKLSDQKVQLTLERERRLLLRQNQEQWQPQRELRKARPGREQPRRRRDGRAQGASLLAGAWRAPGDDPEKPDPARAQADPFQQRQLQRLREEHVLQSLRELNHLQLRSRLDKAWHKRHASSEGQKVAQEGNLSSLVNFQARKVLMDCQAKAEELLKKLSLEQSAQQSQESHQGPRKERRPEPQKAQKEAQQTPKATRREEEMEKQRQVRKRILGELEEQKARSQALKTTARDRAQHLRELNKLQEEDHHILKLKPEREEKCHIEGIKEAIKKNEQLSRGKDPAFPDFQKVPRASKRDNRVFDSSCLDPGAAEAQLRDHQQRGGY